MRRREEAEVPWRIAADEQRWTRRGRTKRFVVNPERCQGRQLATNRLSSIVVVVGMVVFKWW